MATELVRGTFLEQTVTSAVEMCARPQSGSSFFFVTTKGVYEIRWDPLDYMAVVRRVSYPEPDDHFTHFAVMDETWRVGDTLLLARRGNRRLAWQAAGVITTIRYDQSRFGAFPRYPRAIEHLIPPAP